MCSACNNKYTWSNKYVNVTESTNLVMNNVLVMEVSRPGLGLETDLILWVSVSSVEGLGFEVQRSRSRLLYRDHKT